MKCLIASIIACCVIALNAPVLSANEYVFVNDDELALELANRREDRDRAEQRIKDLHAELCHLEQQTEDLGDRLHLVETRLQHRTHLLYRLSRNGKALRYLTDSDSAVAFLKRIQTLKRLVTSLLEEKREITVLMEQAGDSQKSVTSNLARTEEMLSRLTEAINSIDRELQRRQGTPLSDSPEIRTP